MQNTSWNNRCFRGKKENTFVVWKNEERGGGGKGEESGLGRRGRRLLEDPREKGAD